MPTHHKLFLISLLLLAMIGIFAGFTQWGTWTLKEKNYTVSKMCTNGRTAQQEISADGEIIINLSCN